MITLISKYKEGEHHFSVKHTIEFKYRADLSLTSPVVECTFIELTYNNEKNLIGGIYRVPDTDTRVFCQTINRIIEPHRSYEVILLGDYNVC